MPFSLRAFDKEIKMIIFKTPADLPVAIRPSNVVAVEQHPTNPELSAITHIMNRASKKNNVLIVKHTVQEVVDALTKVESWI